MGLVFEHVVGIVEVINCKDVKIQVCIATVSMSTAETARLTAAGRSPPVGHREGPHRLHQQDRRLPRVPEQQLFELRDHQRQEFRDEHPGAQQRWRICEWTSARSETLILDLSLALPLWFSPVAFSRSSSLLLPQSEHPVPEQFKTVWDGQKLVTTVTEIV